MDNFQLAVNTIRVLSAEAIDKAKSGHPGLPLGAATIALTLFEDFLKFNPKNPQFCDRDRFVLSAGHGSMLLYSLLHLRLILIGGVINLCVGYSAVGIFTYVPMLCFVALPLCALKVVFLCRRQHCGAFGTGYGSCAITVISVRDMLGLCSRCYLTAHRAFHFGGTISVILGRCVSECRAFCRSANRTGFGG